VAVKIFRLAGDPKEAARRLTEELAPFARAAAAHVLPVLSAGRVVESDGRLDLFEEARDSDAASCFFLEMPHVLGPNARELVVSAGALSDREIASLLGLLAPKLAGLHADGEVHLDLKPENLMIEAATGRVFITDFGTKAGTAGYAAPEQASSPGPPCDVHALSRLLLELWTGQTSAAAAPEPPPFAGDGAEARAAHRELASLLAAGLEHEPTSRPTSAELARRAQEIARRLGLGALEPEVQAALGRWRPTEVYLAQKELVARGLPGPPQRASLARLPSPRWTGALKWVLVPLSLGIIAATYLMGRPPSSNSSPEPPVRPFVEGVFSNAVPPRRDGARVHEGDRVNMNRAIFEMKVSFQAKSIAVLSRNDEVLDQIENPVPGQKYNWEVQPGIVGWAVDRKLTGRESRQVELGPHETKLVMPTRDPAMAPIP
jgi:serine/threonine protein kinase